MQRENRLSKGLKVGAYLACLENSARRRHSCRGQSKKRVVGDEVRKVRADHMGPCAEYYRILEELVLFPTF